MFFAELNVPLLPTPQVAASVCEINPVAAKPHKD
jgi:hypothetical protein